FPGHDLQYAYWQQVARDVSPVRHLRGDPRNWGDSMNAEGYAHYTEELMRAHGFFSPEEELFALSAQAWRAARIVVDIGLHAGGMSREQAAKFLAREAYLPPKVAAGEAFRYSKWRTLAVTYGLGKRGLERLKARLGATCHRVRSSMAAGPLVWDALVSRVAGCVDCSAVLTVDVAFTRYEPCPGCGAYYQMEKGQLSTVADDAIAGYPAFGVVGARPA